MTLALFIRDDESAACPVTIPDEKHDVFSLTFLLEEAHLHGIDLVSLSAANGRVLLIAPRCVALQLMRACNVNPDWVALLNQSAKPVNPQEQTDASPAT